MTLRTFGVASLAIVAAVALCSCEGASILANNALPPGPTTAPTTPDDTPHAPVGTPARLELTLSVSPALVSLGQDVRILARVTNVGGTLAKAVAPASLTQQGSGSLRLHQVPTPALAELAPGATHVYEYLFVAATTGAITFQLGAQGVNDLDAAPVYAELAKAIILVETAATLVVDALTVPSRVNVGATAAVTMKVSNVGQSTARGVVPTALQLTGTAAADLLEGPTPAATDIPGGGSTTFTWALRPNRAGLLTVSGAAVGLDANSASMVFATSLASSLLSVDRPAALTSTLTVPASLTTGQSFTATWVVTNTGDSLAKRVTPMSATPAVTTVTGNAGASPSGPLPAAVDIAGGASATFLWTFTATGTGSLRLTTRAEATDDNAGAPIASAQATSNPAQVIAPGVLVVTSLTAPGMIQRGQAFNVTMTVRNDGGSIANNVLPSPLRPTVAATGTAAATTASTPTAVSIAAGASATFTWALTESGTGAGTLAFTAGATGTDGISGAAIFANATQSSPVQVVTPPTLVVESVTLPTRLSRGQELAMVVGVLNSGGTAVNAVLPTLTVERTGGAALTLGASPAGVSLAPGARASFRFTATESGTDAGTLSVVAIARGTDALRSTAVSSGSLRSGLCTVQTAAELQVSSFVAPASIQRGQSFAVTMTVINTGQASANAVLPSPSPPAITRGGGAAATTSSAPMRTTLAGGQSQTFSWLFTESGTGSGTLTFTTRVQGTDANSGATVGSGTLNTNVSNVIAQCNTALYSGITLPEIVTDFSTNVFPLMTRTTSGCTGCHIPTSARLFVMSSTASETFYAARAGGFLKDSPGTILDRLTHSDPLVKMPRNTPSWTSGEIDTVSRVVCKLKAFDAAVGSIPADEQFPPNLLEPYTGPAVTTYDNPFINHLQLVGKVREIFGTGWVVGGVDMLQKNIGLFGGVDFRNNFVEARSATAEFLTGMDSLGKDMCAQAVTTRTRGPFIAIDPTAELIDTPGSTNRQFEAEAITKSTGQASGVGWSLFTNGTVSTSVSLPSAGSYTFVVRAYATQAGPEAARMELRIDGVAAQSFLVSNTAYSTFTVTAPVAVGPHVVAVAFTNDFSDASGDRNLIVDWVQVNGPTGTGTGTTRETAARANIDRLYRAMLYRGATTADQTTAYTLLRDLIALGSARPNAWAGLCEALMQHPDFLFARPPFFDTAGATDKQRLGLVRLAQQLLARPPTAQELNEYLTGVKSYEVMVDQYLGTLEFRDYYFHRMRIRTETTGTAVGDEPARLWTYLMMNGQPFQELLAGDYSVTTTWTKATRPVEHGKTGLLTMQGFIQGKPGLPHYNYAARVMSDFMGTLFDIPPEVFDQRATATATSTVDPNSLCYSCHQNLTPLAHQRLRWDDSGRYRTTDETGATIDDSDRGLVPTYAFKGRGIEAFSTVAVRKEAYVRRMFNAHAQLTLGRSLRHTEDERALYKQLWDLSGTSRGNLKAILRAIVTSPTYRRP